MTTSRVVTVAGDDILDADFFASTLTSRLEGGYRIEAADFAVTPYAAIQVTTFSTPAYSEAGVGGNSTFALSYAERSLSTGRAEMGGWIDKRYALADGNALVLRGRLAWAHNLNNDNSAVATFETLPGSFFTVGGAVPSSDLGARVAGGRIFLERRLAVRFPLRWRVLSRPRKLCRHRDHQEGLVAGVVTTRAARRAGRRDARPRSGGCA